MFRNSSLHDCYVKRLEDGLLPPKPKQILQYIPLVEVENPPLTGSGMDGAGFFDQLSSILSKGSDVVFGDTGTAVSNIASKALNKNPEWRPGFSNEKHVVLQTPYGLTRANYAGPGTKLDERIARGDKGVSPVDEIARVHDLRYSVAANADDVRKADMLMVQEVARSSDTTFNKAAAKAIIKTKMKAEDLGIFKPSKFASFGDVKDPAKKEQYKNLIKQSGLGVSQPLPARTDSSSEQPPSLRLKKMLLKKIRKGKL